MNNEPVAWISKFSLQYLEEGYDTKAYPKENEHANIPLYTHPAKTLTDDVVNELWAKSHEDGIAMQHGFTTQQHYFAHLILRKASEK